MRKKMRRHLRLGMLIVAAVFVISIFYGLGGQTPTQQTRYIARIGNRAITQPTFSAEVSATLRRYQQLPFNNPRGVDLLRIQYQTLDSMIEQQLLLDAARKRRLKISSIEITQQVEKMRKEMKLSRESFDQLVRRQYGTTSRFRDALANDLLLKKLREDVGSEVRVSEKEIQDEYTKIHARHILFSFPIPLGRTKEEKEKYREKTKKETLQRAQAVYQRLKEGADFAKLARQFSDDQASAQKGGDLGWFGRAQMVKPFEKVAFSLKKGEISKPFATQYGYHIVQVLDKKEPEGEDYLAKKGEIRKQLLEQKRLEHYQKFVKKVREKSDWEILDPALKGYQFYAEAEQEKDESKRKQQYRKAIRYFQEAVKESQVTQEGFIYYYIGKSYERIGEKDQAIKAYEKARKLEDPQIGYALALLYEQWKPRKKDQEKQKAYRKKALKLYKEAFEIAGNDLQLMQNLQAAFARLGDKEYEEKARQEAARLQELRQKAFEEYAKRQKEIEKGKKKERGKPPSKKEKK